MLLTHIGRRMLPVHNGQKKPLPLNPVSRRKAYAVTMSIFPNVKDIQPKDSTAGLRTRWQQKVKHLVAIVKMGSIRCNQYLAGKE